MSDIIAAFAGFFAMVAAFFNPPMDPVLHGYIEANVIYVAPVVTQRIVSISVGEGDMVEEGDILFNLDQADALSALTAAQAEERAVAAQLANLQTGSRPEELRVIEANVAEARITRDKAKRDYDRTARLTISGVASETALENDKTAYETAEAHVSQLEAELAVARLPARAQQVVAANADLAAAKAAVERAVITLEKYSVDAPVAGRVERRYLDPGEVSGPSKPVLSIQPPKSLEIRFFVPEERRGEFNVGRIVRVDCDGCGAPFEAKIVSVASESEFTPPVIYSREERHRLVYMTKAIPLEREMKNLLPGQPITVEAEPQ
ncbi:HlyD family efflux transporter periplasmic adaptor subunit [Hwanghaeella grinnelliae]|uniref:HlyD family efflux transporter periplasmic adaptor subunit n=1 Tax=Hwanghaeella grinnelliae TaxID=2500179 RepID=A0A437QKB9_9PROT|nr:HlyD family efflux transporter periplasmic adaptor subunit [Hwanghaeella grinnelliae]RVU34955.1 HlyD family efflux transporter periplasmic adaptor subunit [Hwanghaeella grinnelliae]